ncbi:MAG: hypothetical protein NXI31_14155 [bacterium]|nr:hypothetical protein [bacterium]
MRLFAAFACIALLGACAIGMPRVPMHRFVGGDVAAVADAMTEELANGPRENEALVRNILGQCELMLGNTSAAFGHFDIAGRIMGNWSTSGGEEFAAIVGSESSKHYRGDPYEKGMNAFYLALTYLWRGEPDNARAALKRGILADAEVADERFQADNPLLFWMAGRMSLLMGLEEDAASFFAEAQAANAFVAAHGSLNDRESVVIGAPAAGNVVLLFECGMGPQKVSGGRYGELARFRPVGHPAAGAEVFLDGEPLGRSSVISDVDYQATTRGGTVMEGIRRGKAVFKQTALVAGETLLRVSAFKKGNKAETAAIVGGALILLGLLTTTRADVRHWPTLPGSVQALCADVPAGAHQLVIEFLDGGGRVLPELRQEWSIDVPEAGESWFLFRSLPGLDRTTTP